MRKSSHFQRPRRPADVVGNAVKVARIAVGEEEDDFGTVPGPKGTPVAGRGPSDKHKRDEPITIERDLD